ncbi:hypothetical protein B9J90_14355 [Vibrio sp. V09_P4A23P171]|nr:hypothetical protein B9J90_14355 [Vibrio sp. V09_P4A23P171]
MVYSKNQPDRFLSQTKKSIFFLTFTPRQIHSQNTNQPLIELIKQIANVFFLKKPRFMSMNYQ